MVCENISLALSKAGDLSGIVNCIGSAGFSNNDTLFLLAAFAGFAILMYAYKIPMRYAFGVGLILSFLFIPFSQDVFSTIFLAGIFLIGYIVTRGIQSGFKE